MPDKDGKGPREGSFMYNMGRRGPMSGNKQGNCRSEYKKDSNHFIFRFS